MQETAHVPTGNPEQPESQSADLAAELSGEVHAGALDGLLKLRGALRQSLAPEPVRGATKEGSDCALA